MNPATSKHGRTKPVAYASFAACSCLISPAALVPEDRRKTTSSLKFTQTYHSKFYIQLDPYVMRNRSSRFKLSFFMMHKLRRSCFSCKQYITDTQEMQGTHLCGNLLALFLLRPAENECIASIFTLTPLQTA